MPEFAPTPQRHVGRGNRLVEATNAEQAAAAIANLPQRQKEVMRICVEFVKKNDQMPPYQKLASMMNISSPNGAMDALKSLERKGLIERNEVSRYRFKRFGGVSVAQLFEQIEGVEA